MSSEVRALRAEIESLRGLVESLRITVEDLRERVEFSEQQQDLSQTPIRPTFSSRAPRATGSYSLVFWIFGTSWYWLIRIDYCSGGLRGSS